MITKTYLLIILIFSFAISLTTCGKEDVFAYLRSGSTIAIESDASGFTWIEMGDTEGATKTKIKWTDIRELRLANAQIDDQVREIKKWLEQLQDNRYPVREFAERQLSDPDVSAAFKNLIRKHGETIEDDEVRYRINRILEEIADVADEFGASFDRVTFKDGRVQIGNVFEFLLAGRSNGKSLRLKRSRVQNVFTSQGKDRETIQPLNIQTFNMVPDKRFYDEKKHILTSFEQDRFANPTVIGKQVDRLFAHNGLLMTTENPGHMILIKYQFKFCPVDSGSRCVCPYDEESEKRLRGATLMNFCLPDQPQIAAGVYEFGIFLERIEHSRDIVVEAYNVHGQMLGMVEATDQICVFAGFVSNEPITQIRISRNNDLPELDRLVDETYALDAVTFSPPVAIHKLATVDSEIPAYAGKIKFKNGEVLLVDNLKFSLNEVTFKNPISQEIVSESWGKIESLAMPNIVDDQTSDRFANRKNRTMMVQFSDGSIVRTERENFLSAYDFIGQSFAPEKVVGVWHKVARLPISKDFENDKPVIVYPSCRIAAEEFELNENSFTWNKSKSEKFIQNVLLHDEDEDVYSHEKIKDPDLTPHVDEVEFAKKGEQIPSLWLKLPKSTKLKQPHIRLIDGQYFVLGSELGFRILKIDSDQNSIEIAIGGISKTYPMSMVSSISIPKVTEGK